MHSNLREKTCRGPWVAACIVLLLIGTGQSLQSQDGNAAPPPATPLLSPEQLDDLVAPIALYPDPLLSQVLVASTYPLEVVEAEQWLQENRDLTGSQLINAARAQNWDPSVQALVAVPNVLDTLNQDIRWTTNLGNAFLAQQADVMSAVQSMRARAEANGRLNSTPQQTVNTVYQGGQSAIQIVPANPNVVYVPTYDPMYVWGPPLWGAYPYLYYPTYGFGFGPGINIALSFGGWGGWGWGGWGGWGWGPSWFSHTVVVNNVFFRHYGFHAPFGGTFVGRGFGGGTVWAHNPVHRLGVSYPNRQLAGRFQAASLASRANMQRFAGRNGFGQSFAGRNAFSSARQGSATFGSRQGFQGRQSFAGSSQRFGGNSGNFNRTPGSVNSPSGFRGNSAAPFAGSPRVGGGGMRFGNAPSVGGNGLRFGGAQNFGGNRSFSAPRSFAAPRSFGGGGHSSSAPSFSGSRGFGGGGGGHAFGGGGHPGGGGGGGHFGGGGGGGHSGGGGHGRR